MSPKADSLLKRPPSSIGIELTTRCNLSCRMCSVWRHRKEDFPYNKAISLLDEARALGAERFDPYGSELFMREDMPEILNYADWIGFREVYVVSNGVLLNRPKLLDRLEGLKSLVIIVSLDGPKEIHDALRGDGVFEQAVAALRELGRRGMKRSIASIIMRPTLNRLAEMVDLAAELKIPILSMQPYCRDVAGPNCDHDKFEFRPEERGKIETELKKLLVYARRKGITIYTQDMMKHVASYLVDGAVSFPPKGCHVPSKSMVDRKSVV